MNLTYLEQRRAMKNGKAPTADEKKRADKEKNGRPKIPTKSAKTIEREKKGEKKQKRVDSPAQKVAKMNEKQKTIARKKFFDLMLEQAPERCMETDEKLYVPDGHNPRSVCCHILAKRDADKGGVPSVQFEALNIVYMNQLVHNAMDADMGVKSEGNYVRSMKIFPLIKERVKLMWDLIPENERSNIPQFLQP